MTTTYGQMKVTELRALVKGMKGAPAVSRMPKGDLLNWLLDMERAQGQSEAVTEPASPTNDGQGEISNSDEGATEPAEVAPTAMDLELKGATKAVKLLSALLPYGWRSEGSDGDGDRVTAVLRRGDELMTVTWHRGVYSYEESTHLVADRTTRLRNVSAAIKLGSRPAEAVAAEYAKVTSNRRFRPAEPKAAKAKDAPKAATARLFPNPQEPTEDELFAALAGYRVIWINRITNITESAHVSQNATFFRLKTNPAGEPFVTFCSDQGFRACRVADILSTSRRSGRARRTKTLAGGEEVRAA